MEVKMAQKTWDHGWDGCGAVARGAIGARTAEGITKKSIIKKKVFRIDSATVAARVNGYFAAKVSKSTLRHAEPDGSNCAA